MISVYKDQIGRLCVTAGRWIFFLFLCFNVGSYMGGKESYFGVFMPELEVLFPVSAFGVLLVFFGIFLQKKQHYVSWQQYSFLLIILACFVLHAMMSFDSNMTILFLPLFIVGVLGTVLGDEIRLTAQKNVRPLFCGGVLGLISFLAGNHDTGSLLSLLFLFVWITVFRNNMWTKKQTYAFSFGLLVCFLLLENILGMVLLVTLFFGAPLWTGRTQKQDRILQIGFSFFSLVFLITALLAGVFKAPSQGEHSLDLFDRFIFGTGMGQYLPYLQHQAEVFLSLSDLVFPMFGAMLWWKEWGIIGILFLILLFVWNHVWGRMPFVYVFVLSFYFFFSPQGVVQEVFLLFGLMAMLQRKKRFMS